MHEDKPLSMYRTSHSSYLTQIPYTGHRVTPANNERKKEAKFKWSLVATLRVLLLLKTLQLKEIHLVQLLILYKKNEL